MAYFILEVNMQIYENEINDNLKAVMEGNNSIAFLCDISHDLVETHNGVDRISTASDEQQENQPDLYYLNSVLVSAGWNKNDDVFSKNALWAARKTPINKQFNFMHDESDIIGHMTNSIVMDQNGKIINDSTSENDLPQKFDIVTSSVIYKTWSDLEMRVRIAELIEEIDQGDWSVSMECVFSDFDYALVTPDGSDKILARTKESSFLTKHLRSYGGDGQYEGYKLGRLLKGFFFSGKGLVEKPANPRSIIFSKDVNPFNANGTVNFTNFLTIKGSNMTKALNKISQVEASVKAEVDDLTASTIVADEAEVEVDEQVEASPEAEAAPEAEASPDLQAKVAELEAAMEEIEEKMKAMKPVAEEEEEEEEVVEEEAEVEDVVEEEAEKEAEEEVEEEVEEAVDEKDDEKMKKFEMIVKKKNAEVEAMQDEIEAMKSVIANMTRKASLAAAGINEKAAEKLVSKFSDASDDMFLTVIELAKSQANPITEDLFDGEQENEVSASDLEQAENILEPSIVEAGEVNQEVEMSTASEWLRNSVLKLTKNLK